MKKLNFLPYFLLFYVFTFFTACKKENQEQLLTKEELPSNFEKIAVPETANLVSAASCMQNNNDYNTFYGPQVQMGNGHVRSWININRQHNKPMAIGIEFTAGSLQNLPTNPENFPANTFILKLHQKAKEVTALDHITINWEPAGHEPPGIYDIPHFDMHFYKITVEQQMAITGIPGPAPMPGYLPASYVIQAATVPQMGTHWIDPSSPELPPTSAPFTHTFIYGSNNGQVIFIEPMITRAFLLGGSFVNKPFPQPMHFSPQHTYYPTVYKIWKSAESNRHYVALTNFVWR